MGNQTQTEDNRLAEAQALYEVRFMTEEDIPQVCHLEKTSFSQPWSEFAFHSELADNELAYYVVLVPKAAPEQVVGYGGLWIILDEAHITNIAIDEGHRRKGLGEQVLTAMLQCAAELGARAATLEVRKSNTAAQALYEKDGFFLAGVRREYYLDNREDAYIYWKEPL